MDKSAIKSFAIEARKILMKSAVTQAGFYGVSKDGCAQPTQKGAGFEVYRTIAGTDNRIYGDDIKRREKLVKAVEEKGFNQVIEETAYTWFNRLIAIRFMEVNGYLPTRTRVLSSETGSNTPDLMSQYMDVDLDMTMDELEKVQTCVRENRYDDAFALLFVKQCNALNEILPNLFEKTTDYMELLLKLSYTSDGVVRMLVDTIPESNFDIEQEGQIEIIGWMYQYYNTELKDDTFALLKKNVKITKERIPSATQLFTPDWIVRYMVENSLGRLWVEGHPDEDLKANWKYYLEEAEQEADVQVQLEKIREEYRNLNPEDIKVIDPCMGSGHILVYCFDVLMQIYESQGYTQRDAARLILENNLYGLDIDKRAAQLAYFAVMMKARQYDRRIFSRTVKPHIYSIEESNGVNRNQLKYFGASLNSIEKNNATSQITGILASLIDAKIYGSILNFEDYDWDLLTRFVEHVNDTGQISMETIGIDETKEKLSFAIEIARVMSQKYHIVTTNPPYMGGNGMDIKLADFVKNNYPNSKSDLFACFIEKGNRMLKPNGFNCMVTMQSWMFLSSFETMRHSIIKKMNIVNLMHMDNMVMGIAFGTAVTSIRNSNIDGYKGTYNHIKYSDIENGLPKTFPVQENRFAQVSTNNFKYIPTYPIAYWLSDAYLNAFKANTVGYYAEPRQGFATGDNGRFLRLWHEISINKFSQFAEKTNSKWYPCNKGGSYRKWYGNNDYVVNYENDGVELKSFKGSVMRNTSYYFKKGITWSTLSNAAISFRYSPEGFLFESKGSVCFMKDNKYLNYLFGLLNSKICMELLAVLSPTIDYHEGPVSRVPCIYQENSRIDELVEENIKLAKKDWDSYEISWEYEQHPLVSVISKNRELFDDIDNVDLSECYRCWDKECTDYFEKMKSNEEELNRIFIKIYGLEEELSCNVDEKDISIRKADLKREIRSLLSYAVGCMFGRYDHSQKGLICAGNEWNIRNYSSFLPDVDNCIPISDEEYFEDDIVGLFCEWIKTVFGKKSLETNLDFIAKALGNKGTTSREVIRNYFLNDFMKDHIKIYQKRPIYWMFDSGKQNGFKCLTYMHRYDKDTVGRVRSDYLRKTQEAIEAALKNAEYTIQNSTSAIDKATATKKRDKYIKQLSEIRTYFQALSHVALQRIDIDLDDGVKVNYEKFQNIEIVDENGKKQKINLLTKI